MSFGPIFDMVKTDELGSEYTNDILTYFKSKETGLLCRRQSPQLHRRKHLVEWTCEVQHKLGLGKNTLHLAVRLVDLFMDGHDIQDMQLYLVCLGGILIASKVEERDGKIPRCSQLNLFVKNYFPLSDFFNLEFVMLNYFQWNICLPTAYYFTSIILPHSLLPSDLHNNGPILSWEKAYAYFKVYVEHFMKLSIVEPNYLECIPSQMGSAVIAAARRAFGLSPFWPESLELFTGYSEIVLCGLTSSLLLQHGVVEGAGVINDEGYHSFNASPDYGTGVSVFGWSGGRTGERRMEMSET